jgi:HD superfamily phosphohydrolase
MTGLDVDKYDYLQRDIYCLNFSAKIDTSRLIKQVKIIDNNIVYPEQAVHDIYNLFHTRHLLHVQVYCHKVTISTQFSTVEIFKLLDDILGISKSIENMDDFCEQTDSYILNSIKLLNKFKSNLTDDQLIRLEKAKKILNDLESRNLYSVIYHFVAKDKLNFDSILSEFPDKDDILVFQNKIGFVSGNKPNPLDSIYVYKTKDSNKIACELKTYRKKKEKITILMPSVYQECIITLYYKNKFNTTRIKELYKYFDEMFGEK